MADFTPDADAISVPTPFQVGDVNCYVLSESPLTLVDPGPATTDAYDTLVAGLQERGLSVGAADWVLITHPHLDHFGMASWIRDDADANVACHPDAAPIVQDFLSQYRAERKYFLPYFVEMGMSRELATVVTDLPGTFTDLAPPLTVDRTLDGDASFAVPYTLECVESPGHCRGSVSFVAPDMELVFTGDHILPDITPNPLLQKPTDDESARPTSLPQYLDSLRSFRDLPISVGMPGHGQPIPDVQECIEEILVHHQKRADRVRSMVASEPKTPYGLMNEMFSDLPATEQFAGMSEVIGHLDLLERNGRVRQLDREDEPIKYTIQ